MNMTGYGIGQAGRITRLHGRTGVSVARLHGDAGKVSAVELMDGTRLPADIVQMAGLYAEPADVPVQAGTGDNAFCALVFHDDRLVAVECVNRPGDFVAARKLLSRGAVLRSDEAARAGFDLRGREAANRAVAA